MKFSQPAADLFVPDGTGASTALARITHLGIGAHQDDLEFMALHGILECFLSQERWFGGITCTDGAGSVGGGAYTSLDSGQMQAVRAAEQRTAARIGTYGFMAQLAHPSANVKDAHQRPLVTGELHALLQSARPQIVYTHNPFDKHATHIGVFLAVLDAIRTLPQADRPRRLLGCEVWRGLDWLPDARKVVLDVSAHPNLAAALSGVFDSQITSGKRYDLAVEGRCRANATFLDSHAGDRAERVTYAVDLTPLIEDSALSPDAFAGDMLAAFRSEVLGNLRALG